MTTRKSPPGVPFRPRFTLTPVMARDLLAVERTRTTLEDFPLPLRIEAQLRKEARVRVAHNSTWIENRTLTLDDARAVIEDRAGEDPTRRKGQAAVELRNYWAALDFVDRSLEQPLTEDLVREMHAVILRGTAGSGRPARKSDYRAVNVQVGKMEYLPPEWEDVPALMGALAAWLAAEEAKPTLPGPLFAAIGAYQFVTIHPFEDGNGRTTRTLATLLLARTGYGMQGLARMEEFYARDVARYYESLQMGLHHNFYLGNDKGSRSDPDLTPWLSYFVEILATTAEEVRKEVVQAARERLPALAANPLAKLPSRLRRLLSRLDDPGATFTPSDVAEWFGVTNKTARDWLAEWRDGGFVEPDVADAERVRTYRLASSFSQRLREAGVFG